MAQLSVTSRGQVTFRKDVLKHLGLRPGDKIRLDLLPGGRAELQAEKQTGSWEDIVGMLKHKGISMTIDEMNAAIAKGAAEAGMAGLDDA
jgi:bifunctional DNA-binding transcriptional regulator/antitoxin component of YhaV-PrlF toxin-antitoxin module